MTFKLRLLQYSVCESQQFSEELWPAKNLPNIVNTDSSITEKCIQTHFNTMCENLK